MTPHPEQTSDARGDVAAELWSIVRDTARADAEYDRIPGARGGRVLNVDLARELSPAYRTPAGRMEHTQATYEPAKWYVTDRYYRKMKEPPGAGEAPFVLFTAGGPGSGKSTAVEAVFPVLAERAEFVVDSSLADFDGARERIDAALAAGRGAIVTYVHRPYALAVEGMLLRAAETGRWLPLGLGHTRSMAGMHLRSQQTFLRLRVRYADTPRVQFLLADNSAAIGDAKPADVSDLADSSRKAYTSIEQLYAAEYPILQRLAPRLPERLTRLVGGTVGAVPAYGRGDPPGDVRRTQPPRGGEGAPAGQWSGGGRGKVNTSIRSLPVRARSLAVRLPGTLVILLCCGLPLLWLAAQIVIHPSTSLRAIRLDAFHWGLLGRTLGYNLIVAVLATLMALPAALVLGRGRGVLTGALWLLLPVTLLLPSITYAYGWMQFMRLVAGPLGRALAMIWEPNSPALEWLGVTLTGTGPEARAYLVPAGRADVARCMWALATWLWPLPAGLLGLSLRRLDANLQQQALLDGALWRVTARQLAGPLAASVACVAVLAVQEFAVYEPTGISVIATEVRQVFTTGSFSSPTNPLTAPMGQGADGAGAEGAGAAPSGAAATVQAQGFQSLGFADTQRLAAAAAVATSLPLLLIVALLGVIALWGVRRVTAAEDVDVDAWPASLDAGWKPKLLACSVLGLALGIPLVALLLRLQRPLDAVFIWRQSGELILGSIAYGSLAGAVAVLVAAWATVRKERWALPLAVAAFLVGGQLLAIAFIRLYNRPSLEGWVYNAPPIMVMAYVARFGWLPLLAAAATWTRPWTRLREMAAVDGAGRWQSTLHVVWPIAWPVLAAAAVLVMVLSLTEVPATVLISPLRPQPIVPMLMTWVHTLENDPMIEASLLLMTLVTALTAAAVALVWLGVRMGRRGLRLKSFAILVPVSSMFILCTAGCGDSTEPDAMWLETGTAPGQVVYPRAITYSPSDDSFYVIDRLARVQHLDREGRHLGEWQMPEFQTGKPVGLSVGPDGNIYVPDTHYHRVMVYTPQGRLVRQWGKLGKAPGEFVFPTDVAFDDSGNVFVSEYGENDRIQVFDPAGKYLYHFGRFGNGDGEFSRPQSLVIDKGLVYVTDSCNHRLCVFKTDGTFVRSMGGVGSDLGQYRFPYGLDIDEDGRLVVCEFGNNRVQLVDKETGKGLKAWGRAGREPGQLAYPWGVAVDKKNRVVAVDAGNNRLQVFEF